MRVTRENLNACKAFVDLNSFWYISSCRFFGIPCIIIQFVFTLLSCNPHFHLKYEVCLVNCSMSEQYWHMFPKTQFQVWFLLIKAKSRLPKYLPCKYIFITKSSILDDLQFTAERSKFIFFGVQFVRQIYRGKVFQNGQFNKTIECSKVLIRVIKFTGFFVAGFYFIIQALIIYQLYQFLFCSF